MSPLVWHEATRRDNPEAEVYAALVPDNLREYTAALIGESIVDCEVVINPRYDTGGALWGASLADFHAVFDCPGLQRPGHPLVPEKWRGLGYHEPLTRDQLPEPGVFFYARAVDHEHMDGIEGPAVIQDDGITWTVQVFNAAGHLVELMPDKYPDLDAVFTAAPIENPWETKQ